MAAASRLKWLNTLYTNSLKLIGSRRHVTVDAQKRQNSAAVIRVGQFRVCIEEKDGVSV
jgi:hypothetical protein